MPRRTLFQSAILTSRPGRRFSSSPWRIVRRGRPPRASHRAPPGNEQMYSAGPRSHDQVSRSSMRRRALFPPPPRRASWRNARSLVDEFARVTPAVRSRSCTRLRVVDVKVVMGCSTLHTEPRQCRSLSSPRGGWASEGRPCVDFASCIDIVERLPDSDLLSRTAALNPAGKMTVALRVKLRVGPIVRPSTRHHRASGTRVQ